VQVEKSPQLMRGPLDGTKGSAAMPEDPIRILRLFNEKVDRLERSGFLASFRQGNRGYDWFWRRGEEFRFERHLPSEDEIDAFVLTLRLFVQDRDGFSFRRMDEIYSELPVDRALCERVSKVRVRVNRHLDALSPVVLGNEQVVRRHIWEVVLYGGLAHADPAKRVIFESWRANAFVFSLIEEEFVKTLTQVTQGIYLIREINVQALEQLQAMSGSSQGDATPGAV
jgi:hypothetical protein